MRHLTQLTSLSCYIGGALPELSALFPLSRLRQLLWKEAREAGPLQVDLQQLLARLPHLEGYKIYCSAGLEVGGMCLAA